MKAIIANIVETGAARVFELRAADGSALPPYAAGSHIDLTLGNGMVRQYSLCCQAPSPECYRIAVKREPQSRGGSEWLHAVARVGDSVDIGAPRNAFALDGGASEHLLFAGGIGITPILSMAYEATRTGQPFRLHYFARDAASLMFASELSSAPLAGSARFAIGLNAEVTANAIHAALADAAPGAHAYVCGPPAFMDAVVERATARLGAAAVHKEAFGAPAPGGADSAFTLRLVRSGRDLLVPAGETALACLHAAGVDVDCSCEVGICGTCRTAIIEGVPEHRDAVLSQRERDANDCFMPCVSRARTPVLQIDL